MIALIKRVCAILHITNLIRLSRYFVQQVICRIRYIRTLRSVRRKVAVGVPLRVLFVVDNISKWKTQKLYDAMDASPLYEPMVGLTLGQGISFPDLHTRFETEKAFYGSRGCKVYALYDAETGENIPVSSLKPDIVFYQECCAGLCRGQCVFDVSRFALTMYIPYSIEYGTVNAIYRKPNFQDQLFLNICWNSVREKYLKELSFPFSRAGRIVGLGYPFIDELLQDSNSTRDYVIYAPHFSFPVNGVTRPLTIGTFMETGVEILQYAKRHPEIKWVFKPHPGLRSELEATGGWARTEVDAYYSAWEQLGVGCYTSDYPYYFARSKAMITDSASFLIEYPVTQQPLIWLVNDGQEKTSTTFVEPLFETFYKVSGGRGLVDTLDEVIVQNKDPLREARAGELNKLNLAAGGTERIMDYLKKCVLRVDA